MQQNVSFNVPMGVPGEQFDNSPVIAQAYLLESADPAYNIVGSTAYTLKSEGIAQAGGTGQFLGVLVNPKEYVAVGTVSGGPLAPTMTLPNEVKGVLASAGSYVENLLETANIASFTGVVATPVSPASYGVITVSALVAGGVIQPGSPIYGTGVPAGSVFGSFISGTSGGNGTYNTNIPAAVGSTAMTSFNATNNANIGDQVLFNNTTGALSSQNPVAKFTGVIATTTGILTVTNIQAGSFIKAGMPLSGTGVAAGTIVTGWLTGTYGGNGTYSTNVVVAVSSFTDGSVPNSAPTGYTQIKTAYVDRVNAAQPGIAVVALTGSSRA